MKTYLTIAVDHHAPSQSFNREVTKSKRFYLLASTQTIYHVNIVPIATTVTQSTPANNTPHLEHQPSNSRTAIHHFIVSSADLYITALVRNKIHYISTEYRTAIVIRGSQIWTWSRAIHTLAPRMSDWSSIRTTIPRETRKLDVTIATCIRNYRCETNEKTD